MKWYNTKEKEREYMYKLIAIDLDGTLLNSYGEVTKENEEAIQNAISKGIQVVLASGRPIMSVKNLANQINANNYIICGNGAVLYDIQNEQIIYDRFLDKSKVLQIVKICEENSIYYNLYTDKMIIAKGLNHNVLFYNKENLNKPEEKKTRINIVEDIYKYVEERNDENYLKITICDDSKIIFDRIIQKLRLIKDVDVLDVAHMSRKIIKDGTEDVSIQYYYTEITNSGVDKWYAIEDLMNKLSISKSEVMAIGDNVNDKIMIQNAGLGVVMGNSAPYIKEIADIVVSDNDNSGVAEAINNNID